MSDRIKIFSVLGMNKPMCAMTKEDMLNELNVTSKQLDMYMSLDDNVNCEMLLNKLNEYEFKNGDKPKLIILGKSMYISALKYKYNITERLSFDYFLGIPMSIQPDIDPQGIILVCKDNNKVFLEVL